MTESLVPSLPMLRLALALVPAGPALVAAVLGLAMILRRVPPERTIGRLVLGALSLSLTGSVVGFAVWLALGGRAFEVPIGVWFRVGHYAMRLSALVDALSLSMLLVTNVLCLAVARFSVRYLHREPGYPRFFMLLAAFVAGMHVLVLAGSYDLMFAGWEIVGIATVLLVAFFQTRPGPVAGAVRAMVSYRVADVGLLVGAVLLHQLAGGSEHDAACGQGSWPHATTSIPTGGATAVALLLLLAVMGKSAQVPFGGWLPRAMEGPTPSSALFYGALSVHAGVYLLLRSAPLFEASPVASVAAGLVGGLTAVHATMTGRTQADAKNALAYVTMTQVGLMLVEVSLHLWTLALVHMIAHATLRLYQQLRAPSALHDAHALHAALREHPRPRPNPLARRLPAPLLAWLYHVALHRFVLDELLERFLVGPTLAAATALDRLERRWVALWTAARDASRGDAPEQPAAPVAAERTTP